MEHSDAGRRSLHSDYRTMREVEADARRVILLDAYAWINRAVTLLRDMAEHCPTEYADTVRVFCADDVPLKAAERGRR